MNLFRLISYGAALAVFIYFFATIDLESSWRHMRHADAPWILFSISLNLPIAALLTLRSRVVLGVMGYRPAFLRLAPISMVGHIFGSLTPAGAGDLVRAHLLQEEAGVAVRSGIVLVLFERSLSLYLLAASTLVAAAYAVLPPVLWAMVLLALLAAPWAGALTAGRFTASRQYSAGSGLPGRVLNRVLESLGQIRVLLGDVRVLVPWTVLTLGFFGLSALQLWALNRSMESGRLSFDEAWVAIGASTLAAILTLLPFGIGLADASLSAILVRYGLSIEQGSAVTILMRATMTLPLVLIASVAALYLHRAGADRRRGHALDEEREDSNSGHVTLPGPYNLDSPNDK